MAASIRGREISSVELVTAHLEQIHRINPALNAVVQTLDESALAAAVQSDKNLAAGRISGRLHGVPFSVKDSINVAGTVCTAGTLGRRNAPASSRDATVVARLRDAGGIPVAKTNLPDLLFSFETENLIFGRTNNPYDLAYSPGGSSGGEAALIAACGSPLGLGSDAFGSVRVPAAFCGIASIKPTSGRFPRTGHVPPAGNWVEALWQIGPMARSVKDLELALRLLAYPDGEDFTSPPVPLIPAPAVEGLRVAFFTSNEFARVTPAVADAVQRAATILADAGMNVEEKTPPGVGEAYALELALFGADNAEGIEAYLREEGSHTAHPYLTNFLERMRSFRSDLAGLARRWTEWEQYRARLQTFFQAYDAIVCPVYTQPALVHGASQSEENFRGFSYTMAWNLLGAPAATVRVSEHGSLGVNVQVIARPWHDLTALAVCRVIEQTSGGWQPPPAHYAAGTNRTSTGDATSRV